MPLIDYDQETGNFPKRLEDLVDKKLATREELNELLEVPWYVKGDWVYFQGLSTDDPSDWVLLVSPELHGEHVVLRIDARAERVRAADLPRELSGQGGKQVMIPAR